MEPGGRSLAIRITGAPNLPSAIDVIRQHLEIEISKLKRAVEERAPIPVGRLFSLSHDATESCLLALVE
jgi:hypothetical protein